MANSALRKRRLVIVLLAFALAISTLASAAFAVPPSDRGSSDAKQGKRANASLSSGVERSPAKRCKAERTAMGAQAFAEKYGTNANLRNAFGKCVSGKAKEGKPAKR